jgi:multidrug efflux pump subunit AcrA (membrane-fusion protein)
LITLFKYEPSGDEAVRTRVKLGRTSVNTVEILEGLKEGDKVILSDMSAQDGVDRIRLK